MQRHRIAVIGGDGIGPEVVAAGLRVLRRAAELDGGFALDTEELPWGSAYYAEHGRMAPEDALDVLRDRDAIYLGAVGSPAVPDDVTLWGLLLPIRQVFDQYVNLRPVRLLPGVRSPLAGREPRDIDFVCVRENTEGEYCGAGGRVHQGLDLEVGVQTDVFTRGGVERIARYAFELARGRRRHVTSVTKSNAGRHAYVFWDDVVAEVARDYPDVELDRVLVDAAAAFFVTRPERFDVVVGSNLFMDILTDVGAAIQGGMGLAASANVNPAGGVPAMFEPVHGSAPDIAGQGVADPIGAVWAGALMLDHLGHPAAGRAVMAAIEDVLAQGRVRTPDLGGAATTTEMTDALIGALDGVAADPDLEEIT
ncbi:MAG: tartrate dehydrogenase/decarboxylase / D-malate dehydrogenase [Solirubrobacteraceae bacterium]|jgi:tartrate dehydrogenase/decarboxylase/D-malate dehydrogenase|nr:tartrate dehydrogenase/decarboxylase / D-malate dehydrogenase [Solirubrobacteraceae bacterium]